MTVIPLGGSLPSRSSDLPGTSIRFRMPCWVGAPSQHAAALPRHCPLFGLGPCGVYRAPIIAERAVRSYRTFSPLPRLRVAVCFLWHWPSIGLEPDVPDVIRHTTLRSSDFPPVLAHERPSGPAVNVHIIDVGCSSLAFGLPCYEDAGAVENLRGNSFASFADERFFLTQRSHGR